MSNFTKIRSHGTEFLHVDGQTDMAKLIVAFRNFVTPPENGRAPIVPKQTYTKPTRPYLTAYFMVFSVPHSICTASNDRRLINYGFRRMSMEAVTTYPFEA